MTIKKNKFNLSDEIKAEHINKIIAFFHDERNEEIGIVAAGKILDFFLDNIGEDVYNKAIKDLEKIIKEKNDDMETEISILSTNK